MLSLLFCMPYAIECWAGHNSVVRVRLLRRDSRGTRFLEASSPQDSMAPGSAHYPQWKHFPFLLLPFISVHMFMVRMQAANFVAYLIFIFKLEDLKLIFLNFWRFRFRSFARSLANL